MATAYPKFTSASTGRTTWSDGRTSSYANPTPVSSGTIGKPSPKSQLASLYQAVSNLINLFATSSGATAVKGIAKGFVANNFGPQPSGVITYDDGTTRDKRTGVVTYPSGATQSRYGTYTPAPAPIARTGVASKQAQPVPNAKGQAITGAYTTNSAGAYQEVPMQSLGYTATGNLDKVRNIQKVSDKFVLSLNETKKSSWDSLGTKSDKMASLMESTAGEFGKNWNSVDEMNLDYNSNPSIKNALDQFVSNGGTLEQIMSRIQANQASAQPYTVQPGDTLNAISARTGKSVQEIMALNPQITDPNLIQAGSALNLGANIQDSTSYLAEMRKNVITDPEALLKLPQDKLLQNEIARQANIPEQWKDYYLGTPEKMGVFELEKAQKQAQLDLIEEKLADDKRVYKEKAQLQIDKTRAEMDMALAETETNRLKAKNYMTGLLAKLGALNTTGAAGEALVKLDQKYEEMKVNTRAKYTMAIRELEIEMNEGIDEIENGYADKANKIREDLTKSASDITKELMKLELDSQSKIYSLSTSYAKLLQSQKEKQAKALKDNANAYVTEFKSIVSTPGLDFSGANLSALSGLTMKTTVPKAKFTQSERNKLIMAGLFNAPQSEQLAYLYGKSSSGSTGNLEARLEAMLK